MILIVDDDEAVRASLGLLIKQAGYTAKSAENPGAALAQLENEPPELILLDMNYTLDTSGCEGLELLKKIKTLLPATPVILMTAWGSISLAVDGMKSGASDFITKPWNNESILQTIRTQLSLTKSNEKNKLNLNRRNLDSLYNFEMIIGEDPALLSLLETIGRVSPSDASVLILGESGTGKEIIAEAIHQNSNRQNNQFVKVNLGGISTSLIQSELFGHKKGSFTDAKYDRVGRFEMADKGTIFLDEIGDLDLSSQVKLLRVLQDKSFEVLGSSKTKTVNVRVISATNKNLEEMVKRNEFREDLFYRINLITIKLPPLRERPDDLPILVNHFINNLKTIYRRESLIVERKAVKWLQGLPWPGNIRELKNLVERTVLVSNKDIIGVDDFQEQFRYVPGKGMKESLPEVGVMTLDEMEEGMIRKALEFHNGNLSKVAKSLGLSRAALYRRLEKYGLSE